MSPKQEKLKAQRKKITAEIAELAEKNQKNLCVLPPGRRPSLWAGGGVLCGESLYLIADRPTQTIKLKGER